MLAEVASEDTFRGAAAAVVRFLPGGPSFEEVAHERHHLAALFAFDRLIAGRGRQVGHVIDDRRSSVRRRLRPEYLDASTREVPHLKEIIAFARLLISRTAQFMHCSPTLT